MPDMMEQDEEYDLQMALALSMQVRMQAFRTFDDRENCLLLLSMTAAHPHAAAAAYICTQQISTAP